MRMRSKTSSEGGVYNWPNLFEEAGEMLQAAMLMYPLAKLRQLAKDNIIKPPEKILDLPIVAIHAVELVEENAAEIAKEMGDESPEMLKSAMTMIHQRYAEIKSEEKKIGFFSSFTAQSPAPTPSSAMLVAFGDNNAIKELVYGVALDSSRKRVTVAFRGSTTNQDFLTDASVSMKCEENPFAHDAPHQEKLIKIHWGFHDYLLSSNFNSGVDAKGNKFDEIMSIICPLLQNHPDHRLYVTGHSLGGALATLFAFKAASCHPTPFQMPITCVSIASPKVGDDGFRKAFQLLEERDKLRHLRIANSLDPVTMNPPASTMQTLAAFSPAALMYSLYKNDGKHEFYYHVGVKLKLFGDEEEPKEPFKISYSRGDWNQDGLKLSAARYVTHHYCTEYSMRLTKLKKELEKLHLNEIYAIKDKSGVGRSLHERYMEHKSSFSLRRA